MNILIAQELKKIRIQEQVHNQQKTKTGKWASHCPRCGKSSDEIFFRTGALSRKGDFFICSVCGEKEAMEAFAGNLFAIENYAAWRSGEVEESSTADCKTFYFTFGTHECYPFRGGWVKIIAPTMSHAIAIFKANYPNPENDDILRCCDIYNAVHFESSEMFKTDNLGARCHAVFTLTETAGDDYGI